MRKRYLHGNRVSASPGIVNLIKYGCTIALTAALVINTGSFSFAKDISDITSKTHAEKIANLVEKHIDTGELGGVVDTGDYYVDDSGDVTTTIPKEGNELITLKDKVGTKIGMSLPKEVEPENGIATDGGTIVYSAGKAVDICVQSITGEYDGLPVNGMRQLVIIKDNSAPKEYSFRFDLPEGCFLETSEDYYKRVYCDATEGETDIMSEAGAIYIVNNADDIKGVIEAPWAKDANGKEISTYYTIKERTIIQRVEFDENSDFPIIADPKEGDTQTKTYYYKKGQVTKIRDRYAKKPAPSFWESVFGEFGGTVPKFGIVWTVASFMSERINATSYNTWNKILRKFPSTKNRVRVVVKYRWHHKGAWVATGIAKYSYVKV